MNKRFSWFLGLTLIFILLFGAYNVWQRLELVESISTIRLSGEARNNPLYAARIFLNRMGVPAQTKLSSYSLNSLPDTQTALLISSKRSSLSPQRTYELLSWVNDGGHLIIRSSRSFDYSRFSEQNEGEDPYSNDPLQMQLNVSSNKLKWLDSKTHEKQDIAIELKGSRHPLTLSLKKFSPLLISPENQIGEIISLKSDIFMLRRAFGNGMITLASHLDFINNRNIRTADHAEILWQLVHGLNTPQGVWLIYNDDMPNLWHLLWKHAWTLMISLALLLVLWLYQATHRFGALIPKAEENRRSLQEHIAASGDFYWQHQQKDKLIESTRHALNHRLTLRYPNWQQLTNAEKIIQLSQQTQYSKQQLQTLLFDQKTARKSSSPDEFTQLIQQLEAIRNSL